MTHGPTSATPPRCSHLHSEVEGSPSGRSTTHALHLHCEQGCGLMQWPLCDMGAPLWSVCRVAGSSDRPEWPRTVCIDRWRHGRAHACRRGSHHPWLPATSPARDPHGRPGLRRWRDVPAAAGERIQVCMLPTGHPCGLGLQMLFVLQ